MSVLLVEMKILGSYMIVHRIEDILTFLISYMRKIRVCMDIWVNGIRIQKIFLIIRL